MSRILLSMKYSLRTTSAFTLVEILIVLSIFSLLASAVLVFTTQSRQTYLSVTQQHDVRESFSILSMQLNILSASAEEISVTDVNNFSLEAGTFILRILEADTATSSNSVCVQTSVDLTLREISPAFIHLHLYIFEKNRWRLLTSTDTFPMAVKFLKYCISTETSLEPYCSVISSAM